MPLMLTGPEVTSENSLAVELSNALRSEFRLISDVAAMNNVHTIETVTDTPNSAQMKLIGGNRRTRSNLLHSLVTIARLYEYAQKIEFLPDEFPDESVIKLSRGQKSPSEY